MLTITPLSLRAIEIAASGHFTAAEVAPALDRMGALLDEMPKLDILADVHGSPSIGLSAIGEELKRPPLVFRLIRQVERVAIVADALWIRVGNRSHFPTRSQTDTMAQCFRPTVSPLAPWLPHFGRLASSLIRVPFVPFPPSPAPSGRRHERRLPPRIG